MSKCENCLYYEACKNLGGGIALVRVEMGEHNCQHYKDKSLCVELPCKVGDTAYVIEQKRILEGTVKMVKSVHYDGLTRFFVEVETEIEDPFYNDKRKMLHRVSAVWESEWGSWNIAFFTKEEAEQKLKELENGKWTE